MEEIYTSKKDEAVKAKIESREEKYGTVLMCYIEGPNTGKTFNITESTLKRWWRKEFSENPLMDKIDFEKVNTPFPEPKIKKYIPKPESVIRYEQHRTKNNTELPSFEDLVDILPTNIRKINDRSCYVMLHDKSTIWRKQSCIDMYVTEKLWVCLSEAGLLSKENKDKERPFSFKIKTKEDMNKVLEVLKNV